MIPEKRSKPNITAEELREKLTYSAKTGIFRWKIGAKKGKIAGNIYLKSSNKKLYRKIGFGKYGTYQSHQLAWLYVHGEFPGCGLDHVDHDGLNNRISNLRKATNQENHRNQSKYRTNSSGVTGVRWNKNANKWESQIWINGKNESLGYFELKSDAISARKAAEKKYGFHENHGV